MLVYQVSLTLDSNETLLASLFDIPEANSVGKTHEHALENVFEAFIAATKLYISRREAIPIPSKLEHNQPCIVLSALESSKILIWNELIKQDLRKSELGRRLKLHGTEVDRIFDLDHSSKFQVLAKAATALGKNLVINLV